MHHHKPTSESSGGRIRKHESDTTKELSETWRKIEFFEQVLGGQFTLLFEEGYLQTMVSPM
jgi:hypothetical protein